MATKDQVMQEIRNAQLKIELADAVERLQTNPDFIKVFSNHYFKEHVIEVVNGIHLYSPDSDEHIETVAELECISRTKAYLTSLIDKGQWARSELLDAKSIPDSELD